jgi:cellulose synthase/poly-beta-1,6-N-acetylglucosamine synthase-like glycosyltransferase
MLMIVWQAFRWLLLAAQILIGLPLLYLCILSISAILTTHRRKVLYARSAWEGDASHVNFAILIPAHNEEAILDTLLESLSQLTYPKEKYSVYVVADNCTDDTAKLVRATSRVHVYERFDSQRRGKGYALSWLMQKLTEDGLMYDAYVILDADSVVIPGFLQPLAREITQGAQAVQACNTVLNTTTSPSTALRWVALTLVNHVRSLGRNGLGASSTLNGNGMCLTHDLLKRYPWQAFGQSEDYQYYLTLIENGERTHYVPEAVVRSQMPTTFAQMRTQDIRWESSDGSQAHWQVALRLLLAGIKSHDLKRIEAMAELLTPPLSFLAFWCLLTLIISLFLWSLPGLFISLLLIGALLCYIGTALYLLHPPRAVYIALLHAPGFVIWKLWVYFVLRGSKKHVGKWVRTSRSVPSIK